MHEVRHAPCSHAYGKHDDAFGRHRPLSSHVGVRTTSRSRLQVGVPHGVPLGRPAHAPAPEEEEEEDPVAELPDEDVVDPGPPSPPAPTSW